MACISFSSSAILASVRLRGFFFCGGAKTHDRLNLSQRSQTGGGPVTPGIHRTLPGQVMHSGGEVILRTLSCLHASHALRKGTGADWFGGRSAAMSPQLRQPVYHAIVRTRRTPGPIKLLSCKSAIMTLASLTQCQLGIN